MNCTYKLGNLNFGSELELDDFIISNGMHLVDLVGDAVYQKLSGQQAGKVELVKNLQTQGKGFRRDLMHSDAFNYMFEERIDVDKKYTAITKFLSGLTTIDKQLMFPQMIKENFFAERWDTDWKRGVFTARELESLKDVLQLTQDADGTIRPPEVIDSTTKQKIIEAFETKWEAEAKIGSAIHKVCETFFKPIDQNHASYDKSDKLRIKGELELDQIVKEVKRYNEFNSKTHDKVTDYLSDEQIEQVIQFCKNLKDSIETTWSAHSSSNTSKFIYFAELPIKAKATHPVTGEETNLAGVIDLLVIDPNGVAHIVDYKVSPADFQQQSSKEKKITDPDDYSAAKVLAFDYQLSTYARMLRTHNAGFRDTTIAVAPIQLLNLKYDRTKKGKWGFSDIELNKPSLQELLTSDQLHRKEKVEKNLDQIFVDSEVVDVNTKDILTNTTTIMYNFLKDKNVSKFTFNDEDVAQLFSKSIKQHTEGKLVKFSATLNGKLYESGTKEQLLKALKNELNKGSWTAQNLVEDFKAHIKRSKLPFRSSAVENTGGKTEWYEQLVSRYNADYNDTEHYMYEIVDTPKAFDYLGIVVLKNIATGNYEIIKLTRRKLKQQKYNGKNKKLTGAYIDDIEDESKENYILDALQGNIELLETLAAINQTPSLFTKGKITKIQVVNPHLNSGLTATNKQLLYTYNTLTKYSPIPQSIGLDYIKNGNIKFCNLAEQAFDIIFTGLYRSSNERNQLIQKCVPDKDAAFTMTDGDQKKALEELLQLFENGEDTQSVFRHIKKFADIPEITVNQNPNDINFWYYSALLGYAEIMGFDFRQQASEYSNYIDINKDTSSLLNILEQGHSGLLLDNPGTTANKNVNMVSEQIENIYSRLANRLQSPTAKIQKLVQNLKDENGKGWLQERVSFNPLSIYKGITKTVKITDNEGDVWDDWVFENPRNLSGAQKELAEYALLMINYNRYGNGKTLEQYKVTLDKALAKEQVDLKLLRVPLYFIGTKGVFETNGLMKGLSDYLKSWKYDEIKRRFKEEFGHLYTSSGEEIKELFRMGLIFDRGESVESRKKMLRDVHENNKGEIVVENRINQFDHDIERLLLKHLCAYYLKDEFNEASYLIKASLVDQHIAEANHNEQRKNDISYITTLTKKMTGKKILSDKEELIKMYVDKFMSGASVMALGFSPKQIYQCLEGIYKDIGILIRKPDGSYAFTFSEMLASFADVWKEIGHFGNQRSKLERINELFRLNDMDMNVYAQHLQDRHNVWHDLSTFLFRFASRPDFYNRLTIIESYMRHDGVWDTYELNENNELVYHFEKDPRFSALVNNQVGTKEYNEQLGLYNAMAEQFEREGAYNKDGTKFVGGSTDGKWNPLPQAYTNKEVNSFKALTDQMYGYYSHEKKALVQSSLIGAMFFQMYTYFSGKKNQWLAPGSVKNQGRMEHYEELVSTEVIDPETGETRLEQKMEKFYYQVKEDGTPDFDLPPVPESQLKGNVKIPFIRWKGTFTQGVLTTLSKMLGDIVRSDFKNKSFVQNFKEVTDSYWNNEDENLRTAYRQNLKQFAYESAIFTLVGGLLGSMIHRSINTYTNNHDDDHSVAQGFKNASLALFDTIFSASTLDFNAVESLGGRGVSWTPFSIDMWKRTVSNWSTAITGDRTFTEAALRTFSASKYTIVPFLDTIKDVETAQ